MVEKGVVVAPWNMRLLGGAPETLGFEAQPILTLIVYELVNTGNKQPQNPRH